MNSRERILTTLQHKEPDRVPVDLGSTVVTGISAIAYNKLKGYLGINNGSTRIYDLAQQLAQPEIMVLDIIDADVLPVIPKRGLKVSPSEKWKESKLPDGSPCEVPEWFNPEILPDGSQILRDETERINLKMPKDGYYFDKVLYPLEDVTSIGELEKRLDNIQYGPFDEKILDDLHNQAKYLYENTNYALILNGAGGTYEWAQNLRGWSNFMMDLAANQEFACVLLDKIVEANIKRLEKILPVVEGYVPIVQITDDIGMQNGPQLSPELYRKIVKERQRKLYQYIKGYGMYLFLHSCGSVYEFIPDFIEIGVDILNPVQLSARGMDTKKLKREFGKDITFWGGGCDTQHILPFGTPQQVKDEVKKRIEDLAPNGGFVFTPVHNIQADVPPENIMAMYKTVKEFGRY